MKILILLIALVVLVVISASSPASAVFDTGTSLTDSNTADNEPITYQTVATNSSPSATITITMYALDDDELSAQTRGG